jgi:hypothetical protein
VNVQLIVEGGGDGKDTRTECRRAFRLLLERAGLKSRMPRILAGGSRVEAFRDFSIAFADRATTSVLLVDSERPVAGDSPWMHLAARPGDGWTRPAGAADDQCHLMVEAMEAWLLADRDAVAKVFGKGFRPAALPDRIDVEQIPKSELLRVLEHATRDCAGPYRKGARSFQVLAGVDPVLVQNASHWAKRFFTTIARFCS